MYFEYVDIEGRYGCLYSKIHKNRYFITKYSEMSNLTLGGTTDSSYYFIDNDKLVLDKDLSAAYNIIISDNILHYFVRMIKLLAFI